MESQAEAVSARIAQLQAGDLPSALQGLLKQALVALKPPSKRAGGREAAAHKPAAPAAARRALVQGLLLLLERGAALAQQPGQQRLRKARAEVGGQLAAAFLREPWLWELLIRKHLAELLQHPAAAAALVEAVGRLDSGSQARAYGLLRQALQASQQQVEGLCAAVGLVLPQPMQRALLEQLGRHIRAEPLHSAAATASRGGPGQQQEEEEVQVSLVEQLSPLLHLLLVATAGGSSSRSAEGGRGVKPQQLPQTNGCQQGTGSGAALEGPQQGSSPAASASIPTTLLSAAVAASSSAGQPAPSSAGCCGGGGAVEACGIRQAVVAHAALLIGRLSQPEALHDMLGLEPGADTTEAAAAAAGAHGGGVEGSTPDAAASERLSTAQVARVRCSQALIEACAEALLTLPWLAAGVRQQQLRGQRRSIGGEGEQQQASTGSHAAGECQQQPLTGGAEEGGEATQTVATMMVLHRELSKLLAAAGVEATHSGSRPHSAPHLSLPACQALLAGMVQLHQQPAGAAGPASSSGKQRRLEVRASDVRELPPALLLLPPWLAAHVLELVRQALSALPRQQLQLVLPRASGSAAAAVPGGMGFGGATNGSDAGGIYDASSDSGAAPWQHGMAVQAFALYSSCYQAVWGERVLQGEASSKQLLTAAARLRRLLQDSLGGRQREGGVPATAAAEGTAAEAAALGQMAGKRSRRSTGMPEVPQQQPKRPRQHKPAGMLGSGGPVGTGSGGDGGGNPVSELLQLLMSPAAEPEQQLVGAHQHKATQQGQHRAGQPSEQQAAPPAGEGPPPLGSSKPARRRIVPQLVQPAAAAATLQPTPSLGEGGAVGVEASEGLSFSVGPGDSQPSSGQQQPQQQQQSKQQQQRVIITKSADMTDEEKEAMWTAYIADKELLVEMLGDSEYQQWHDEAAHPPQQGRRAPGGLQAAWDAVLGPSSGSSLLALVLPQTLLEASGMVPWEAAAAAALQLLHLLLGALPLGSSSSGSSSSTSAEGVGRQEAQSVLLRAVVGSAARAAGGRTAIRILRSTAWSDQQAAARAPQAAPAGGALLLLATQLYGLLEGQGGYFQKELLTQSQFNRRSEAQQERGERQAATSRPTAPILLTAYCRLLAALLPLAAKEAEEDEAAAWPLESAALVAQRLLLLPPPLQQLVTPEAVAPLLRLAVADSSPAEAVAYHASLLWLLLAGRQCSGAAGEAVDLGPPGSSPPWLRAQAQLLQGQRELGSAGHALLLGPAPAVQQAAVAELLQQLQQHLAALGQQQQGEAGGQGRPGAVQPASAAAAAAAAIPVVAALLPALDACCAGVQRLQAEQAQAARRQQQQEQQQEEEEEEQESGEEDEEQPQQQPLLLLGGAALLQLAELAAQLCGVCAAAAGCLAAALDGAIGEAAPVVACTGEGQKGLLASTEAVSEASALVSLSAELGSAVSALLEGGPWPPSSAAAQQRERLAAAAAEVEGQREACRQLLCLLPDSHPLWEAVTQAMAGAPTLWHTQQQQEEEEAAAAAALGAAEDESGAARRSSGSHSRARGHKPQGAAGGAKQQGTSSSAKQRPRRRDVHNPYLRAILAESRRCGPSEEAEGSDLSDMEDFIVANPERDYEAFIRHHFPQAQMSDGEEEAPPQPAQQQQKRRQQQKVPQQQQTPTNPMAEEQLQQATASGSLPEEQQPSGQ